MYGCIVIAGKKHWECRGYKGNKRGYNIEGLMIRSVLELDFLWFGWMGV